MIIVSLALLAGMFVWMICAIRKVKEQLATTIADCEAGEVLMNWRIANPDLYIGDVAYARWLVLRKIATYRRFLEAHPYIKDKGNTDFLYSLLDEYGPPPPSNENEPEPIQPVPTRAVDFFRMWAEAHPEPRRRIKIGEGYFDKAFF